MQQIKLLFGNFPTSVLGALTLFIYVGVETLSLSTAVDYAKALNLENPDLYAWIPSIGMVIGYICGIILIPQYLTQDMAMRICACIGVAGSLAIVLLPAEISIWAIFLMALGCSLMWPALWPLAMGRPRQIHQIRQCSSDNGYRRRSRYPDCFRIFARRFGGTRGLLVSLALFSVYPVLWCSRL